MKTIHAPAGTGALRAYTFDVALLVSVLGEIPEDMHGAAIEEIARGLKSGGTLAVVEGLPDPHRQSPEAVRKVGGAAGLQPVSEDRFWAGRLLKLRQPLDADGRPT